MDDCYTEGLIWQRSKQCVTYATDSATAPVCSNRWGVGVVVFEMIALVTGLGMTS